MKQKHIKNTKGAFLDVVHTIQHAVLHFMNITQFHDTHVNVNSFTDRKAWLYPTPIYSILTKPQPYCVQISYTKFQPNQTINVTNMDRNCFTPQQKVRCSLHRFSKKSQQLNKFSKSNEKCKRPKFNLHLQEKHAFCQISSHKTLKWTMALRE